jgi:hypothetical protein
MEEIRAAVEQEVHQAIRHTQGEWVVLLPDGNEVSVRFRRDGTTEVFGGDGLPSLRLRVCVVVA